MHRILILGPQGCGKGTQAALLSKKLGVPQLSMGQLLREAEKRPGELADKIRGIITTGNLVSDQVALEVLEQRLAEKDAERGFILDGFPRNEQQFKAFDAKMLPTMVIVIEVPREVSLERLMKRVEIEHRVDDTPEVINRRLQVYEEETRPMIDHYVERGLVRFVDGSGTIEEVAAQITALFGIEHVSDDQVM